MLGVVFVVLVVAEIGDIDVDAPNPFDSNTRVLTTPSILQNAISVAVPAPGSLPRASSSSSSSSPTTLSPILPQAKLVVPPDLEEAMMNAYDRMERQFQRVGVPQSEIAGLDLARGWVKQHASQILSKYRVPSKTSAPSKPTSTLLLSYSLMPQMTAAVQMPKKEDITGNDIFDQVMKASGVSTLEHMLTQRATGYPVIEQMKNSHVHSPRIMFANHLNRKQNLEGTAVNNTSDDGSPDGEDLFDSENRVTTGEDVMAVLRKTLRGMQLKMNQENLVKSNSPPITFAEKVGEDQSLDDGDGDGDEEAEIRELVKDRDIELDKLGSQQSDGLSSLLNNNRTRHLNFTRPAPANNSQIESSSLSRSEQLAAQDSPIKVLDMNDPKQRAEVMASFKNAAPLGPVETESDFETAPPLPTTESANSNESDEEPQETRPVEEKKPKKKAEQHEQEQEQEPQTSKSYETTDSKGRVLRKAVMVDAQD